MVAGALVDRASHGGWCTRSVMVAGALVDYFP